MVVSIAGGVAVEVSVIEDAWGSAVAGDRRASMSIRPIMNMSHEALVVKLPDEAPESAESDASLPSPCSARADSRFWVS